MNSTHKCEVVPVELLPHPNADALSIVQVFGYTCCVRTEDWKSGERGVFIPPDSLVDTGRPEFKFLNDEPKLVRIKAKKLRGISSYGLLIKAPSFANEGEDFAEYFGVEHYEPPEDLTIGGECVAFPYVDVPIYDVDSFQRYAEIVFVPNEVVVATEKVHGTNFRATYRDGQYFVGSHRQWKADVPGSLYWKALHNNPLLMAWLVAHPNYTVFGEAYGMQKNFPYNQKNGSVGLVLFDVLDIHGQWMGYAETRTLWPELTWVPEVAQFPFEFNRCLELAEGASKMPGTNHIREGIVIKPLGERFHATLGRVQLKVVSMGYLEKK